MFERITKNLIPPISPEGYSIVFIVGLVTFFISLFSLTIAFVFFIIFCFLLYSFRDPVRLIPDNENFIVSPADGLVVGVEESNLPPELKNLDNAKRFKVVIFLSVFDVHVNRIPISGVVSDMFYTRGTFYNASFDKSSSCNERQLIVVESNGKKIIFSQIAGFLARKIVCNLFVGQNVVKGDRFGIIKFGSRVEIYLPEKCNPSVAVGQRVVCGETIIADLSNKDERVVFRKV